MKFLSRTAEAVLMYFVALISGDRPNYERKIVIAVAFFLAFLMFILTLYTSYLNKMYPDVSNCREAKSLYQNNTALVVPSFLRSPKKESYKQKQINKYCG